MIVDDVETVSQRGKGGKPGVGGGNRQNRDLVRLNLTLTNVSAQFNGATLQCAISDASLAQKIAQFRLQVFGEVFYLFVAKLYFNFLLYLRKTSTPAQPTFTYLTSAALQSTASL